MGNTTAMHRDAYTPSPRLGRQERQAVDSTPVVRGPAVAGPAGAASTVVGSVIARLEAAVRERDATIAALEERLCAARRLESVGLLAAGVAHDFRNFLTGILANASLAIDRLPEGHEARDLLQRIREAGAGAADLVRHMLDYAGRGQRATRAVDLSALADEMSRLLGSVVAGNAEIGLQLDRSLPRILGDPTTLRQLVMNLVTNASDALGGAAGTIAVTTERLVVPPGSDLVDVHGRAVPHGPWLALSVRDTGCGMDEATRRSVFDPFFTTKPTGRGLGMASAKSIVREHGALICLDTGPGRGTNFTILFPEPAVPVEFSDDSPVEAEEAPCTGTVLVIDDELAVRLVAKRALERRGYDVVVACDGDEGVALFREYSDEVVAVFLDLSMPRRDGPDVLREIRSVRTDVPVVLTSGFDEREARERFAESVAPDMGPLAGFVQKPFEPPTLVRAIRRATAA